MMLGNACSCNRDAWGQSIAISPEGPADQRREGPIKSRKKEGRGREEGKIKAERERERERGPQDPLETSAKDRTC